MSLTPVRAAVDQTTRASTQSASNQSPTAPHAVGRSRSGYYKEEDLLQDC